MSHSTDFWIASNRPTPWFNPMVQPPHQVWEGGPLFDPQLRLRHDHLTTFRYAPLHLISHVSQHGLLDCFEQADSMVQPHFSHHGCRSLSFSEGGVLPKLKEVCCLASSFDDFLSWISLSKAMACSISFGMTLNLMVLKSTTI